jgi:hypothetical protein
MGLFAKAGTGSVIDRHKDHAGIFDSLAGIRSGKSNGAFPASPYRRMDSGAVGSLVADYPLQITAAGDPCIQKTVDFLMESCLHEGVFFQDMIHSGMNPYLTLCIAQTLLRAGDLRYRRLVEKVGALASPTGQWPEAVHPFSGGGCMGDGQHGWAAAEWVQVIRNLFVREENGKLILGSGLFPEWIQASDDLFFGPTPTPYGDVTLRILKHRQRVLVEGQAAWRNHAPEMEIRISGYEAKQIRDLEQTHPLKPLD